MAGGSSGGEGALIAMRGSPLGIGTDIAGKSFLLKHTVIASENTAGSIRIPALCSGTYGFKPSTRRLPEGGQSIPHGPGYEFFLASAGPLANDFEDLRLLMKHVITARPSQIDVMALDIPWRRVDEPKPRLRIGLIEGLTGYPLHPPVKRTLDQAVVRLRAAGQEIVHLSEDDTHIDELTQLVFAYLSLDATGVRLVEASGEPFIPSVCRSIAFFQAQDRLSSLKTIASLEGLPRLAALNDMRNQLKTTWRRLWERQQLDAVILPVSHHTAVPHDTCLIPPFTAFLNILDVGTLASGYGKESKTN